MFEEEPEIREGPIVKTTYHCRGCSHLELDYWKDYLDNDETDNGTAATCLKLNRSISPYYLEGDSTPKWCPFLPQGELDV